MPKEKAVTPTTEQPELPLEESAPEPVVQSEGPVDLTIPQWPVSGGG